MSMSLNFDTLWKNSPAATAVKFSEGEWGREPHLNLISSTIARVKYGTQYIIITIPPGHGKSELVSHWTPPWYLSLFPKHLIGLASYNAVYARSWGEKAKDSIVANPELGINVKASHSAKSDWELTTGGGMITTGVGGPLTGRRLNVLIIDDPIKNRQEADSATKRNTIWRWYTSTARTRMEPNGSIIIVMTRWHEDDLVGRLETSTRQGGSPWTVVRLPAIADEDDDPLGRRLGEPLWSGRYGLDSLAASRIDVGPYDWLGMYQQKPSAEEGSIFKQEWWQWFDLDTFKVNKDEAVVLQCWDTAFKRGQENDWSVCVTWIHDGKGFYLVDVYRKRLEYPGLLKQIVQQADVHRPDFIFVEDSGSGQSAIQSLRTDTDLPVLPSPATADKPSRAHQVTGLIEAGRVFLPRNAHWLVDFLHEVHSFPKGTFDDQVDAFVGGLTQLKNRRSGWT